MTVLSGNQYLNDSHGGIPTTLMTSGGRFIAGPLAGVLPLQRKRSQHRGPFKKFRDFFSLPGIYGEKRAQSGSCVGAPDNKASRGHKFGFYEGELGAAALAPPTSLPAAQPKAIFPFKEEYCPRLFLVAFPLSPLGPSPSHQRRVRESWRERF